MKAVLISIQPKWCEMIARGEKTIEVRKTRPKIETPFKVYVYMTKHKWIFKLLPFLKNRFAKVIGEFVCDDIIVDERGENADVFSKYAQLSLVEQKKYGANKPLFGWHISKLKIYYKPKELGEFWAYNEELHERFANGEDFCCYNGTNEYGELLNECAVFETDIMRCYSCWEEWSGWCHRITRPPQSWCYVEDLL